MLKLTEVLNASFTTRNAFNHWQRGRFLSTSYADTKAGSARKLSRENALEIAFFAALTQGGIAPGEAKIHVRQWLECEASGNLDRFWVATQGRPGVSTSFDEDVNIGVIADLLKELADGITVKVGKDRRKPPFQISVIDRAGIVGNIDTLIAETRLDETTEG
jgi:hypothetical protein